MPAPRKKKSPSKKTPRASATKARATKTPVNASRPRKKPAAKAPTKKPTKKPGRRKLTKSPRSEEPAEPTKKPRAKKPRATKPRATKKPGRTRRPARMTHLAPVEARVRAAVEDNRINALELIAEIRRRKARIADDFHAIGRALRELSHPAQYGALGYATFAALLKGEKLISKTIAYKLIAVAEAYPAEQAHALGVEKAYLLIAYADATPAPDLARTLAAANPRIGNKYLESMSSRDLVEATRRVRSAAGTSKPRTEPERDARRVAREVQRSLRAEGAKTAKARATRLDGRWRIRIDLAVEDADVVL